MRVVSLLFHDVYRRDPAESGFVSQAANRYKLTVAQFEAQLAGILRVRDDAPVVIDGRDQTPSAAATPFTITVDDGGVSYYTEVADRLEALGWRGHCFVTTDRVGTSGFLSADQVRELDRRGHVIGTHTASHPYRLSTRPEDEIRREWARSRGALEDLLGHRVASGSVPGGYFAPVVARTAAEAGIDLLFTSEPVVAVWTDACTLVGRFAIRDTSAPDAAARFVSRAPWTRLGEWTSWNAKGLVKPLLGNSYVRVANWIASRRTRGLADADRV